MLVKVSFLDRETFFLDLLRGVGVIFFGEPIESTEDVLDLDRSAAIKSSLILFSRLSRSYSFATCAA
jgi:hypothetical protein